MIGIALAAVAVVWVYSMCKCSGTKGSEQKYYDHKGGDNDEN
jgi:hypothetical protein